MIASELADLPGCHLPIGLGALYMLLQLQSEFDDLALVERLIRDFQIATLPGRAFGVTQGCTLRISYGALEPETVLEGIGRLKWGLQSLLRTR